MPRPWRSMAISYATQSLGVVLLVKLALFAPAVIAPLERHYEAIALTSTTPAEPKPSIAVKVVTAPPVSTPAMVLPRVERARIETITPPPSPKTLPMPVMATPPVPVAPKVIATGTFD